MKTITKFVILIFMISFFYGFFNPIFDFTNSFDTRNTDIRYYQNVETMILTLDDMPYGWSGSIKGWEGDYLVSSFRNVEGFMPKTLRCEVAKYDSIELAQNEYNRLKEEHKNTKLKPFNAGNEGFIFTALYREQIIFRKGNVVAIFDGVYNSHEKFAKIVDKKIDPALNENIIISPTITP
ncbi:MAG: hypothetical protein KAJ93_08725, partial [Methanosarcinales archaeon]|nr:hypothetical protein [Methanosarcinales archaeon]